MRKVSYDFNRWEPVTFSHYLFKFVGKRSCGRVDRTFQIYQVIIKVIMTLLVEPSHRDWPLYQVRCF